MSFKRPVLFTPDNVVSRLHRDVIREIAKNPEEWELVITAKDFEHYFDEYVYYDDLTTKEVDALVPQGVPQFHRQLVQVLFSFESSST
jgi:hypothetical protein